MYTDKLITALMSGFSDSFTPPRIAVAALLGLVLFLFRDVKSLPVRFLAAFFPLYCLGAFGLRIGALLNVIAVKPSDLFTAIFYITLGLGFIAAGVYSGLRWYQTHRFWDLQRGLLRCGPFPENRLCRRLAVLSGGLAGCCAAFLVFTRPVHVALMAMSSEMLYPGFLWSTVWGLFFYELGVSLVLAVIVLSAFYWLDVRRRFLLAGQRTMVLSVVSALYISFGVGLVSIYIQQLF